MATDRGFTGSFERKKNKICLQAELSFFLVGPDCSSLEESSTVEYVVCFPSCTVAKQVKISFPGDCKCSVISPPLYDFMVMTCIKMPQSYMCDVG